MNNIYRYFIYFFSLKRTLPLLFLFACIFEYKKITEYSIILFAMIITTSIAIFGYNNIKMLISLPIPRKILGKYLFRVLNYLITIYCVMFVIVVAIFNSSTLISLLFINIPLLFLTTNLTILLKRSLPSTHQDNQEIMMKQLLISLGIILLPAIIISSLSDSIPITPITIVIAILIPGIVMFYNSKHLIKLCKKAEF